MQEELWYDNFEEALKAVVQALGGPKAVGLKFWPTKDPVDAGRLVNHCLDSDRAEKFTLAEILWLLHEGARAGCHAGMNYLADHCCYERPRAVTKESKRDDVRRQLLEQIGKIDLLRRQLERLE